MKNKWEIIALGQDGKVVLDETTKSNHPISEILMYVGQCAKDLWFGRITDIAISKVRDGN